MFVKIKKHKIIYPESPSCYNLLTKYQDLLKFKKKNDSAIYSII